MSEDLTPKQMIDIEAHLRSRGLDPDRTQVIMDKESNIATFILYNLSGQLVGYQRYNPSGDKKARNDSLAGKYFTYVTKESPTTSKLAVWGTETINKNDPNLFVTEGIFDAVKLQNAGHAAIAVLTNNPKILKPWFKILNKKTIAIVDNDDAGRRLGSLTDEMYIPPEGFKDLGDMSQDQVNTFLTKIGYSPHTQHPDNKSTGNLKKFLNTRIKNPKTGNDILIKTALRYPIDNPVRKAAETSLERYSKQHNIKIKK